MKGKLLKTRYVSSCKIGGKNSITLRTILGLVIPCLDDAHCIEVLLNC
jgi:hypothetical protein